MLKSKFLCSFSSMFVWCGRGVRVHRIWESDTVCFVVILEFFGFRCVVDKALSSSACVETKDG